MEQAGLPATDDHDIVLCAVQVQLTLRIHRRSVHH